MAEGADYQDASQSLPPGVEESLGRCGGIGGLAERLPDDEMLAMTSTVHRALADPIRLKILAMLAIQPLCVCVIKAVLSIADSKLSYHLSVLKKGGLIAGDQQGNWIVYRLTDGGATWAARSGFTREERPDDGAAKLQRKFLDHCNYTYSD